MESPQTGKGVFFSMTFRLTVIFELKGILKMCGRLACGLQPEEVCNSCCYKEPGKENYTVPQWMNCHNSGKAYKPSYNICPTDVAPVLLSGTHFNSSSRVIAPMVFGVIAQWSKMSEGAKYRTINCRVETLESSKLYGSLLRKGQRCVVICNGYYEWQNQPHGKSPYFIHAEQPEGVEVDNPGSWNLQTRSERCLKPLRLAALFEISSSNVVGEKILSFTVITKEATAETCWLHGRMPAVLEADQQVDAWLNFQEVDAQHALQYIFQKVCVVCVPVSNTVNAVTNKDISCIKRKQKSSTQDEKKQNTSSNLLEIWLGRGQKRKSDGSTTSSVEKIKKE